MSEWLGWEVGVRVPRTVIQTLAATAAPRRTPDRRRPAADPCGDHPALPNHPSLGTQGRRGRGSGPLGRHVVGGGTPAAEDQPAGAARLRRVVPVPALPVIPVRPLAFPRQSCRRVSTSSRVAVWAATRRCSVLALSRREGWW